MSSAFCRDIRYAICFGPNFCVPLPCRFTSFAINALGIASCSACNASWIVSSSATEIVVWTVSAGKAWWPVWTPALFKLMSLLVKRYQQLSSLQQNILKPNLQRLPSDQGAGTKPFRLPANLDLGTLLCSQATSSIARRCPFGTHLHLLVDLWKKTDRQHAAMTWFWISWHVSNWD